MHQILGLKGQTAYNYEQKSVTTLQFITVLLKNSFDSRQIDSEKGIERDLIR